MLFKLSIVSFILALCQVTLAQVPFPYKCPPVKVMDNFNLDAYMGVWYEYAKYPFVFEIGKRCMHARYENVGNNTVSVVNAAINRFTGLPSNVTGKAKVIAPGQLAVMFSSRQPTDRANYLVLGTDYTSYALVYSCTNFSTFAHTEIVWILTRERKPSADAISSAKKIMDDNMLSQSFLMETIQDNCEQFTSAGSKPPTSVGEEEVATVSESDPDAVAALNVESFQLDSDNVIQNA